MNKKNSNRIKFGIYTSALLMMGAIGISSSLSSIGAHFKNASQTLITSLIAVPCLVVIPVTLISGALMNYISKKHLLLAGIFFFLTGGVLPAFCISFEAILLFRGIFGIGIGLIQTLNSALIAEYFDGSEKDSVQGNATSAQMMGCIIMSFIGGRLGTRAWNHVFFVHLLAILSLLIVALYIPSSTRQISPPKNKQKNHSKGKLTPLTWFWAFACMLFFIAAQTYSNSLSFLITEKGLGNASQSGNSLAFFALGGFLMGLSFGKLMGIFKKLTLSFSFLLLAVSYLIIAFSGSMICIYVGSIIAGLSVSAAMACIMVESGNSVPIPLSGMAVALATCFQNIGMFLSPYIITPMGKIRGESSSQNYYIFLFSAVILVLFSSFFFVWGRHKN